MKDRENEKEVTNKNLFSKIYKKHLELCGKINCGYCKYNRGENRGGKRKPKDDKYKNKNRESIRFRPEEEEE